MLAAFQVGAVDECAIQSTSMMRLLGGSAAVTAGLSGGGLGAGLQPVKIIIPLRVGGRRMSMRLSRRSPAGSDDWR
jgi:hypothetical protein